MPKKLLNTKTNITIDFGAEQYCVKGGELCSDAYKYFYDDKGHFIIILNQGLSFDERAATESSKMASDLIAQCIKSGVKYNRSLKKLNSVLLKSTDFSLVTTDIASIDLCTGLAEFYKAGAEPSVLRQNGKIETVESYFLPAGILRDICFDDPTLIKCKVGDVVVLMSDGATSEGCDWIRNEILSFRDGTAQDLAEHLCMCARQQRSDKSENDITILCAILREAV